MSRFSALLCVIPVCISMAVHMYFIKTTEALKDWNENFRLDLAVNYATDAAMQEVVDTTEDLGADYANWGRIKVSPEAALDEFVIIMLKNYNMSTTDANIDAIRIENIPLFAVASYDGLYIAKLEKINDAGARDLIFSNKIPYVYKDTVNDKTYCLNLKGEEASCFDRLNNSIRGVPVPSELTIAKQTKIVNNTVSTEIMNALWDTTGNHIIHDFYIPESEMTVNPTNSVSTTTIIAYIDNFISITGNELHTFGIGGSDVTVNDFVCCYYDTRSNPVYTYQSKVPSYATVVKICEDATSAAQDGWYFDLETL